MIDAAASRRRSSNLPQARLGSAIAAAFVALAVSTMPFGEPPAGAGGTCKQELPGYHSPYPISEPRLFGDGFISTLDFESDPAFTPDGRTLYFVKSSGDRRLGTILFSRFADGGWTIPKTASFSGKYSDRNPFITADGTKLYYASDRPAQ